MAQTTSPFFLWEARSGPIFTEGNNPSILLPSRSLFLEPPPNLPFYG